MGEKRFVTVDPRIPAMLADVIQGIAGGDCIESLAIGVQLLAALTIISAKAERFEQAKKQIHENLDVAIQGQLDMQEGASHAKH